MEYQRVAWAYTFANGRPRGSFFGFSVLPHEHHHVAVLPPLHPLVFPPGLGGDLLDQELVLSIAGAADGIDFIGVQGPHVVRAAIQVFLEGAFPRRAKFGFHSPSTHALTAL